MKKEKKTTNRFKQSAKLAIKSVSIILAVLVLFCGCSNGQQNVNNQGVGSPQPGLASGLPNASVLPTPPNGFVVPLEGQRPIAVMIDNQGLKPLPQGGLNKAQIIYEVLAEGGITRFMPVFWGVAPDKIGPVRSSRHYFVQFAYEHDAIYVHIGGSPQAKLKIASLGIADVNGLYDRCFWKLTSDNSTWQDKYTSYEKLMAFAKQKNIKTTTSEKLTFKYNAVVTPLVDESSGVNSVGDSGVSAGANSIGKLKSAKEVGIDYNSQANNRYVYNAKTQLYMRYRNGVKHMERNSGKQLSTGNIIIQYVSNSGIIGDPKNRQELNNIGSGSGWYITCGKAVAIKWSKNNETSKTFYTYKNGKLIVLNPAQTWIQVVPPSVKVILK